MEARDGGQLWVPGSDVSLQVGIYFWSYLLCVYRKGEAKETRKRPLPLTVSLDSRERHGPSD